MKFTPANYRKFASLVGQENAISIFKKEVAILGSEIQKSATLVTARAGMGKTALLEAFCGEARELGARIVYVENPTALRTPEAMAVFFDHLRDAVLSGCSTYLIIDEAHEAWTPPKGKSMTVSLASLVTFLRVAMDPAKGGAIEIELDGFEAVPWKNTQCKVILATNHPELIHADAIHSRVEVIGLEKYSDEDMAEIVARLVKASGLRGDPNTLHHLVRVCRGTAREMDKILLGMLRHLNGKVTINRADVFTVLKEKGLFPGGIDKDEASMLVLVSGEGQKTAGVRAMLPSLAVTTIREGMAFLMSPTFKLPLVRMAGTRYQRTKAGDAYILECRKEGFAI